MTAKVLLRSSEEVLDRIKQGLAKFGNELPDDGYELGYYHCLNAMKKFIEKE